MHHLSPHQVQGDVLIVDDMPANLRLLSTMLERHGYAVRGVTNGQMALMAVRTIRPALILLDVKMPEMDGFTVCQQLKADDDLRSIPVIFLSALDDAEDKVQGFAVGGADYITKPFQAEEVLVRIQHQLALKAAQQEIIQLNADLEHRVLQRTNALNQANQALQLEIKERQQAQRALQKKADELQAIVAAFPDLVFRIAADGTLLDYNASPDTLALSSDDILGQPIQKILPSAIGEHYQAAFQELRHTNQLQQLDYAVPLADGIHEYEARIIPFQNQEIIAIVRDVSDRKHIEAERDHFFSLSLDLLGIVGFDGTFKRLNPSWQKTLGHSHEALLGEPMMEWVHDDDRALAETALTQLIRGEAAATFETRYRCQNGSYCWLSWSAAAFPQDRLIYISARNIDHRKQAETILREKVTERTAQLQQSLDFESTLRRITDKVRDSLDEVYILQTAMQELAVVLDLNGCSTTLHRLETGELVSGYQHNHKDLPPTVEFWQLVSSPIIYHQIRQGHNFQFCYQSEGILAISSSELADTSYPQQRWLIMACPIFDAQDFLGGLWLVRAQTEEFTPIVVRLVEQIANHCAIAIRQARLYEASQLQVQELAKLNNLKDDFLSTVSHELRSPVANMKMAIRMVEIATENYQTLASNTYPDLQAAFPTEKLTHYLSILKGECQREIDLINDLLDLQRLDAHSHPLTLEPIQLADWLTGVVAPFQDRAEKRQQHLSLTLGSPLPLLTTDGGGLRRILAELLHNACKYTPPGEGISLQVWADGEEAHFQVKNHGVEIPEDALPYIFEKFYRVPSSDRWKQGGTGLGLALVKKLVGHLNGALDMSSMDNTTTFIVHLPLAPPSQGDRNYDV